MHGVKWSDQTSDAPFDPISESCLSAAACHISVREYEVIVLAVSVGLLMLLVAFSFPLWEMWSFLSIFVLCSNTNSWNFLIQDAFTWEAKWSKILALNLSKKEKN